jgi:hypothetical protein
MNDSKRTTAARQQELRDLIREANLPHAYDPYGNAAPVIVSDLTFGGFGPINKIQVSGTTRGLAPFHDPYSLDMAFRFEPDGPRSHRNGIEIWAPTHVLVPHDERVLIGGKLDHRGLVVEHVEEPGSRFPVETLMLLALVEEVDERRLQVRPLAAGASPLVRLETKTEGFVAGQLVLVSGGRLTSIEHPLPQVTRDIAGRDWPALRCHPRYVTIIRQPLDDDAMNRDLWAMAFNGRPVLNSARFVGSAVVAPPRSGTKGTLVAVTLHDAAAGTEPIVLDVRTEHVDAALDRSQGPRLFEGYLGKECVEIDGAPRTWDGADPTNEVRLAGFMHQPTGYDVPATIKYGLGAEIPLTGLNEPILYDTDPPITVRMTFRNGRLVVDDAQLNELALAR